MEENVEVIKKDILSDKEKEMLKSLARMVLVGMAIAVVIDLVVIGAKWRIGHFVGVWMRSQDFEAWRTAAIKYLEAQIVVVKNAQP